MVSSVCSYCRVLQTCNEEYANSSSILLILAVGSFAPQILRIRRTQSIEGISPFYVLWNLISATEQITIFFFLLVNFYDRRAKTVILHYPISAGDWFSLSHCAVVTILFLVL